MAATQRDGEKPADEQPDGQGSATPDQDGPHDVPDEKVIEQTLPTKPARDAGDRPA
jgi:hypothetical protein